MVQGSTVFGAANAPARVRLYVGGVGVELSASAAIGANIYAPNADVALSSALELWGAVFANRLEFSGDFTIHYDSSVLATGGCAPAGGPCVTCNDCAGVTPACSGGTCMPCAADEDCCAPLACRSGACVLPPP